MAKQLEYSTLNQFNANVALKNRLYVSGFLLSGVLRKIRESNPVGTKVAIHYSEGVPVGVAVHVPYEYYQVQVFVRKSFRGKGIGSKLLKELDAPFNSRIGQGSEFSAQFWNKNGMRVCYH